MEYKDLMAQMKAWEQSHEARKKQFWDVDYPKMSREEKVIYWRKDVFNAMEWQEEQQQDKYKAFTKDWMDYHLSIEPDFVAILKEIAIRLSLDEKLLQARLMKD